ERRARGRIRRRRAHLRPGRRAALRKEGAIISRVTERCARRPWLILGATALAAVGAYAGQRSMARDAIPDLSDPRIGVVAEWMGAPPTDAAATVHQALTSALDHI